MKKEPGSEQLLQRSDLKLMYDESSHWSCKRARARRQEQPKHKKTGAAFAAPDGY